MSINATEGQVDEIA